MGFKGGEASGPAYFTVAWMIHFSNDWLKILEANKKSDRDSQRSVLEMFWSPRKEWWLSWTCLHSWKCMLRQSCATWHWLVHKPGCFFLRAGCILRTWTIFRKMCDWIHETYHTWSGFAWISLSLCSVQTLWTYKRYQARALRALGLLLADGTPTVGGGKTFWAVSQIFLRKQL